MQDGDVRCLVRVEFYSGIVGVVPFAVEGCFDDYEDDEEEKEYVFDEVDGEVPSLRALPAGVAGLEEGHCAAERGVCEECGD